MSGLWCRGLFRGRVGRAGCFDAARGVSQYVDAVEVVPKR